MKTTAGLAQRGFSLTPNATRVVKFEQRQKRAPSAELVALCGNVPRVARLLALAYRIDGMIRAGKIRDWADAARLLGVTRARMTQIANLLLLDPSVQDKLLHFGPVRMGPDPVTEHDLRSLLLHCDWETQRQLWRRSENLGDSRVT